MPSWLCVAEAAVAISTFAMQYANADGGGVSSFLVGGVGGG